MRAEPRKTQNPVKDFLVSLQFPQLASQGFAYTDSAVECYRQCLALKNPAELQMAKDWWQWMLQSSLYQRLSLRYTCIETRAIHRTDWVLMKVKIRLAHHLFFKEEFSAWCSGVGTGIVAWLLVAQLKMEILGDQMELQHYKRRAKRLATGKQKAALVLPQEIVYKILTFLSVATLLRLKSVSKQWYALIRDRNFIDKHLRRSKSFSIAYKDKVLRLPNSPTNIGLLNNQFVPIGGCRGLLLQCAMATSKYFIRNPTTRQILDLPDPQKSSLGMSLAHVKTTGEYKVISVHTDPDEASREGCEI